MPTVLRESGELIQCLETFELPANCLLVTADVSSLYPKIDIKKAIIALDLLLREAKVAQTPLLAQDFAVLAQFCAETKSVCKATAKISNKFHQRGLTIINFLRIFPTRGIKT